MNSIKFDEIPAISSTMPEIKLTVISNLWIKLMTFVNTGDFIPGHKHLFDHPTILSQGSVEVNVDGNLTKFTAPAVIFIERDKVHKITALENNTIACCVHALRNGNETDDIISEDMIPQGTSAIDIVKRFNLTELIR